MPQAKDYKTVPRTKPLSPEESEAAKEARRRYNNAWAKANPDKVKAIRDRYWARRAAREQQQGE